MVSFLSTNYFLLTATTLNNTLAQTGNNNTEIKEYQFITKWGSLGTEPGQFDGQNNVAGSGEFIYVPDYHNLRIQKFTNDGQFIKMCGVEHMVRLMVNSRILTA